MGSHSCSNHHPEHHTFIMKTLVLLFAIVGFSYAVLPNMDNHDCLRKCMKGTIMGKKLEKTHTKCDDKDRTRSIDSDQETERKTHCATYQHMQHYMTEMDCEIKANGWAAEDIDGKVHWNKYAIGEDMRSFSENHDVGKFFMDAEKEAPAMVENWMERCNMNTAMTLEDDLKICTERKVYTTEQVTKLKDIINNRGTIITQNMCIRALFGVACECNDFDGTPLATSNEEL